MPPKPPKPGSRDARPRPFDPEGAAFLALLSELDRKRLAVRCGIPPDGDPTDRILAAVATSSVARRLLATLEHDPREALLALYAMGDAHDANETERILRVVHGWNLPRTRAALDRLREQALVAEQETTRPLLVPFPTLERGLGHDLIVWLAGGTADAPPQTPFVRRLALLLAHLHADPLERTQQHVPAVRWLERAAPIFDPIGFPRQLLVNLIAWLGTVGALEVEAGDEVAHVTADASALLRGAPDDLVLAYAERDDLNPAGSLIAALVAFDRARQTGDASLPITDLTTVAEAWFDHRYEFGVPYDADRVSLAGMAWAIRRLRTLGLVEVTPRGDTVVVRRTPAARLGATFRCTVLPTFEVLVGADAEPAATAELGWIADLVSADRVARFALTAESLARAARGPGGAEAAIERLAAAAEHGLPDGVRATITGWARRARPIRMYTGTVVVAETPEHAAWLRANPRTGDEIAPNVFRIEASSVPSFRTAAEASNVPIVRIDAKEKRSGADEGGLREVERSAKEIRERVERWAKPVPAKPKRQCKRDETPYEATEPYTALDALFEGIAEPTTYDELLEDWPRIARAVRKLPDLLDVALRLPSGDLDEMEFETTTAGELLKALLAWKHDLEDDGPPTTRGRVPQPIFVESSPASDAPTDAETWTTMPLGALSAWLEDAAAGGDTVEIVYVNASGFRSERKVVALKVLRAGGREWLEARDVADGSTTRFDLDRIAAVRGA